MLHIGYCFSEYSDLIHRWGWSQSVGVDLEGVPPGTCTISKAVTKRMGPKIPSHLKIQCGMVFEVRHPFFLYKFAVGVVQRKLRHGYFVAKIETNERSDYAEFIFHVTSDYILPCGFCEKHNLDLDKPLGEDETFSWTQYFSKYHVQPLIPESCFKVITGQNPI